MLLPFESTGMGPQVVLVHGAAPPAWGTLPEYLTGTHRVVAYSRRGFPPVEELGYAPSLRAHADDLAELLHEVGPATVLAWSSGGLVALDLALRDPDLVERLIVIEAPLHAKRRPSAGMLQAVLGARLLGRTSPERGARHFLSWALGRSDGRPSDLRRLDPEGVRRAAPAIVHELTHGTGEREIQPDRLASLEVDTTWLVGTASVPSIARLAVRAARRSPRIGVRAVEGAGHAIALDAPEDVARAITQPGHVDVC